MKSVSPLLGFNNNVKHKGKVFHIQTEDSGVKHPHVITHLFVDGGRILKSTKTSYAEFLEDEQLTTKVRQLMQEQHKAMFIALRAGKFDHLMDYGDAPGSSHGAPASAGTGAGAPAAPPRGAAAPPSSAAAPPSSAAAPPSSAAAPPSSAAAPPSSAAAPSSAQSEGARPSPDRPATVREGRRDRDARQGPASSGPSTERSAPSSAAHSGGAPASVRPTPSSAPRPPSLQPPPPRPSHASLSAAIGDRRTDPRAETIPHVALDARPRLASPALELNLETLERSTGDVKPSSMPGSEIGALPPPPAAVLGRRAQTFNTGYRSIQTDARAETPARGAEPAAISARTPTPPTTGASPPRGPAHAEPPRAEPPRAETPRPRVATPMPARSPAGERRSLTPSGARYAPSRPASIFGSARPQEGSSIFGEDLISEKSLDEVILSYLAEDLDGSKPKR